MSKEKDDAPQLSEYANTLDPLVKKRYMQKIACIGVDPFLISCQKYYAECLPPTESIDLVSYLVLETSHYNKEQFKAFKSLQAYNQLVSGFVQSVHGLIIAGKHVSRELFSVDARQSEILTVLSRNNSFSVSAESTRFVC